MVNFHTGNHLKQISESQCLLLIADSVNFALNNSQNVAAVLENTAGQGKLGWPTFRLLMKDQRLDPVPFILETIDDTLWEHEIRQLKQMEES
jgi:deoxyribonuclease-4